MMIENKMYKLTLKNVKFLPDGHEGSRWECDLALDGKIVAHVSQYGDGSEARFYWEDRALAGPLEAWGTSLPPLPPTDSFPMETPFSLEMAICDMLDAHESYSKLGRLSRTHIVYRTSGMADEGAWLVSPTIHPGQREGRWHALLEKYPGAVLYTKDTLRPRMELMVPLPYGPREKKKS